MHLGQVQVELGYIELQHWVAEHTDGDINESLLLGGEADVELLEQRIGQVHIVDAVVAVQVKFTLCKVGAALTSRIVYLGSLLA